MRGAELPPRRRRPFGALRQRAYRVSTYSRRGFESELSEPVSGEPAKSLVPEDLFGNGLEGDH